MDIKKLNEELDKTLNEKLSNFYLIFYNADFYHGKNSSWYDLQRDTWFTEERGYSKEEINKIKSLVIGDYFSLENGNQVIVRIKSTLY